MDVIPVSRRLRKYRKEDLNFETSLGCMEGGCHCIKNKTDKNKTRSPTDKKKVLITLENPI